jgi:hypothetical protein
MFVRDIQIGKHWVYMNYINYMNYRRLKKHLPTLAIKCWWVVLYFVNPQVQYILEQLVTFHKKYQELHLKEVNCLIFFYPANSV